MIFSNNKNQISDVAHTFTFSTADFWEKNLILSSLKVPSLKYGLRGDRRWGEGRPSPPNWRSELFSHEFVSNRPKNWASYRLGPLLTKSGVFLSFYDFFDHFYRDLDQYDATIYSLCYPVLWFPSVWFSSCWMIIWTRTHVRIIFLRSIFCILLIPSLSQHPF